MATAGYQAHQGNLAFDHEDEGLFTADNETFQTDNGTLAGGANLVALLDAGWHNDASFLPLDHGDDVTTDRAEVDANDILTRKRWARAQFQLLNAPEISMSTLVRNNMRMGPVHLRDFLTRPPIQRDPEASRFTLNDAGIFVEYDFVHFKTDDFDKIFPRHVLHYEIAQALHRQTVAEEKIREDGYKILYAVGDAQTVLLMRHLRAKTSTYGVHYDPAETRQVEVDEKDTVTGVIKVRTETKLGKPYYVRDITDETIVQAFQSLTAPCIIFCVGEKVPAEEPSPMERARSQMRGVSEKEMKDMKDKNEEKRQKIEDLTKTSKNKRLKKRTIEETLKMLKELEQPEESEEVEGEDYTVRPWQACAFFEDKINDKGELTFNTTVHYWEMPYDQLPKQPFSFVRGEAFKKVPKPKDQSDMKPEWFD